MHAAPAGSGAQESGALGSDMRAIAAFALRARAVTLTRNDFTRAAASARQQAPFARESWRPSSSMPTAPRTNDQAVYRDGCEWFQAAGFCGLVSTCRGTL